MKVSCPLAYRATLCLVVYLACCSLTATAFSGAAGGAEGARAEAYRANLLTPLEERIVGQRLSYLYERRHKVLKDADAQARLSRIATQLRAALPELALDIKIIEGAQAEAVSFPPGRIYVTRGLVKLASTDDELAAVIAHEAAHIASHHLSRLIALALALPVNERERFPRRAELITGQALQFAFPSKLDGVRLRCEIEADLWAVGLLERAGYDGKALALLLENITESLSPQLEQERDALQSRSALLREQPLMVRR